MGVIRSALILMLVAIWLPASSHVLLETLGLIHEVHSHHHDGDHDSEGSHEQKAHNHDLADGLCRLELSDLKLWVPSTFSWCSDGFLLDLESSL